MMLVDPEFLSTYKEKHACGYGIMAVLNGEPCDEHAIPVHYPADVRQLLFEEYHYFELGRTIGTALNDPTARALLAAALAVARAAVADPATLRARYPVPGVA